MKWKDLFPTHILQRGFDYFDHDLVHDVQINGNKLQATVMGSDDYEVFIEIVADEMKDMNCDCPYAADGNYCKHMAATLYYVEEHKVGLTTMERDSILPKKEDISRLVREAEETNVRDFVIHLLEQDEKLINRFKTFSSSIITSTDFNRYKRQIDQIFNMHRDRHGFIDYYSASEFIDELQQFLDEDVNIMVKSKLYKEAFELTNYIFIKVDNQAMDDSDGGIGIIAETCLELWQAIVAECSLNDKRAIFQWFYEQLGTLENDYMEEYIEQILFANFIEKEFLALKHTFTVTKLAIYQQKKEGWSRQYLMGKWAMLQITVMEQLNEKQTTIDHFCEQNIAISTVRKYYIQSCIKRKRYDEAVHLLEEGKIVDKDKSGLVADYSLQLKSLYQKLGRQAAYEKELWLLVLSYKVDDLELYKELKAIYNDEQWVEKREQVFENTRSYAYVDKLYELEGLYDRLLQVVLDSPGIYKLQTYEKKLRKLYPELLLKKYEEVVEEMASYTSDRKTYQQIVAILRKMKKYPDGQEKVVQLVSRWKTAYSNRRAMMDELKKL
ncbi:SWIM zinc finger domain-containing protein [Paenibacillus yanchengensis]|uniref:SWIM zinc finger domain-containing protein n=1 Tax=Paenibacillus yanchengensis TaxID=2035833 RepID=A0ABW4YM81_9BACL